MDSLNRVDEKKSVQRASAGVSGSSELHATPDEKESAGDSGARIGNIVMRT